ncbi:phosphohistidine phosphatase SixA [Billgrantia saliphila]|uniref:phosphohistidine phosphatase SixA n=1 Tax=Billgrantia saliphila TaxID=1848458 RepID=UPI000CE4DDC2|nr:phosphohistidine phosphatase SixA [Halomonas saliphila]
MSRLLIMRHGDAAPGFPDHARELTSRGHVEAGRVADWLRQERRGKVRLLSSPYRRARQTAEHVAAALGSSVETLPCLTPDDPPVAVADWLLRNETDDTVFLVSHMPLVGALTGLLVEGRADRGPGFPTAGVVELESDVWAAGCASLLRFIAPHDIPGYGARP